MAAASFALSIKDEVFSKTVFVYFLIFIFWVMDTYYLWQERKFRCLYGHVRKLKEDEVDFDMNTKEIAKKAGCSLIDTILSPTLLLFYLTLMIFTVLFFNWK